MTIDLHLFQVALEGDSGLPEDVFVNTFYVNVDTAPVGDQVADVAGAIRDFYLVAPDGAGTDGNRVADLLSNELNGNAHIKAYRVADPTPRVPVHELDFDLALTSTTALPSQLSCCLSYEALPQAGIPQARRRGRVYIGPLVTGASGGAAGGQARPLTAVKAVIGNAGRQLVDRIIDLNPAAPSHWVVYSRPVEAGAYGASHRNDDTLYPTVGRAGATYEVVRGWVDDAFDIQRRRQHAVTSRTLWTTV